MSCNCASRAQGLLRWLGFIRTQHTHYHDEAPSLSYTGKYGTLIIPEDTLEQHHFRASLLSLVVRLLAGPQRWTLSQEDIHDRPTRRIA